ncbi:MAG: NGG1p interacting factor NIF3 [Candidatus Spechtbacteria bacterium]|nr:NGG1p interacting factor NIF3 [Candidatus Spechtbacteria bacterium]
MKLQDIYKQAVDLGMKADPRGEQGARRVLEENRKAYEAMKEKDKAYYDMERLENPYSDTRILYGGSDREIKKVMVGIDIDDGELIIAKQLGNVEACIAHHPEGIALAGLDDVMHMQADVLNDYGVPINVAEAMLNKRILEVTRNLSPGNHYRVVEIARLADMPFMCTHTVTDNMAFQFLKNLVETKKPYRVGEVFDMLMEVPEYKQATRMGFGPQLFAGNRENRAGIIAVTEITGGTEGAPDIYEKMAQAGVGTVIAMHQSEKHREFADQAHINVIVAGHMSSDSIGMNLFLDTLEEKGVAIEPCGGLIRNSRN